MVDTARTLSALQTLLANNSAGNISAQDLRDMMVSLQSDYGEMYISTSAEDTISTQNTWIEATASTYTLNTSPTANNFSMGTNGRLQYDGNETRAFLVIAGLSMISPSNNKVYEFGLGVDGTVVTSTIIGRKIATGADVGAAAAVGILSIASGSYITIMARNTTDTTNVQLNYANVAALGLLI